MTKEYFKRYHRENKEMCQEYQRAYYQKNKEKIKEKNKRWREANPERYKEMTRRHGVANREKINARSKEWYANNKERASRQNREKKLRGYGLTQTEFEIMLAQQQGICLICQREMRPPVIDHDHQTGKVRGLLCRVCNAALGQFQDSMEILQRAIAYLSSGSSGAP